MHLYLSRWDHDKCFIWFDDILRQNSIQSSVILWYLSNRGLPAFFKISFSRLSSRYITSKRMITFASLRFLIFILGRHKHQSKKSHRKLQAFANTAKSARGLFRCTSISSFNSYIGQRQTKLFIQLMKARKIPYWTSF